MPTSLLGICLQNKFENVIESFTSSFGNIYVTSLYQPLCSFMWEKGWQDQHKGRRPYLGSWFKMVYILHGGKSQGKGEMAWSLCVHIHLSWMTVYMLSSVSLHEIQNLKPLERDATLQDMSSCLSSVSLETPKTGRPIGITPRWFSV